MGVDRVVAFADVHGAYAEMLGLLRETGVEIRVARAAISKRLGPDPADPLVDDADDIS